jgi:hypothetical protein
MKLPLPFSGSRLISKSFSSLAGKHLYFSEKPDLVKGMITSFCSGCNRVEKLKEIEFTWQTS